MGKLQFTQNELTDRLEYFRSLRSKDGINPLAVIDHELSNEFLSLGWKGHNLEEQRHKDAQLYQGIFQKLHDAISPLFEIRDAMYVDDKAMSEAIN